MSAAEIQAKKMELIKLLKPVIKFKCQKGNSNPFTFNNTSGTPIQGVKINCAGCTKVSKVKDNVIEGIFKVGDQYHFNNEDIKLFNTQGYVIKPYENHMTLYFEDGQPVSIFKDGILIDNPLKLAIVLNFKAEVTVYK